MAIQIVSGILSPSYIWLEYLVTCGCLRVLFLKLQEDFPQVLRTSSPPPPSYPPPPQCLFAKLSTCVQVIKISSSWHAPLMCQPSSGGSSIRLCRILECPVSVDGVQLMECGHFQTTGRHALQIQGKHPENDLLQDSGRIDCAPTRYPQLCSNFPVLFLLPFEKGSSCFLLLLTGSALTCVGDSC